VVVFISRLVVLISRLVVVLISRLVVLISRLVVLISRLVVSISRLVVDWLCHRYYSTPVDMKRPMLYRELWMHSLPRLRFVTLCEIPSDYSPSLAKSASLNSIGGFCALGESK
jgi:hypothetical protein